jgi:hypothetical protein
MKVMPRSHDDPRHRPKALAAGCDAAPRFRADDGGAGPGAEPP